MQPYRFCIFMVLIMALIISCSFPALQDRFPFSDADQEPESIEQNSITPTIPQYLTRQPPLPGPAAPTDLNVALQVSNKLNVERIAEPITSGVPLPKNLEINDAQTLQLVDKDGNPVPAQFTPLARWGASPGDTTAPIRWVLLDFFADISPQETAYYYLQQGGPGPVPDEPLLINNGTDNILVEGGNLAWVFSKQDGKVFGPNLKDGIFLIAIDSDGQRYTSMGDVEVSLAMEGPLRASIHIKGKLRNDQNNTLLSYTARYWVYAGKPLTRIFITIENNNLCPLVDYGQLDCYDIGSSGSVEVSDVSIIIPGDLGDSLSYSVVGIGQPVTGDLTDDLILYQDSSGTDFWNYFLNKKDWDGNSLDTSPRMQSYVTFKGYKTTLGERELDSGDQALGRLSLLGESGVWSVGVHDFWQNFPKALRADSEGNIEVALFPREFGGEDYNFILRAGEHKTHEVWLSYAAESLVPEDNLFAEATPEWYVNSGAFGMTSLQNWSDWPEHEQYINDQMITSQAKSGTWEELFDNIPHMLMASDYYGIFDFGDWPQDYEGYEIAPLNSKYDWDYGAWLQWARGGDPRWLEIAVAADRHIADIDILHNLHNPRHWGDGIAFGHSYHDEEGFINPHRNYGGNHPDTAYGLYGMLMTYYMTGYEKAYESALELADCIVYRVRNDYSMCDFFPAGQCNSEGYAIPEGLYDSGSRPVANSLSILVEAFRATADPLYLTTADAIVRWAKPQKQPYINGTASGELAMKPWLLNMYLKSLSYYIEMKAEFSDNNTFDSRQDYLDYANWLRNNAWIDLQPIENGPRAAYPYEWFFDGRQGDPSDEYSVGNNVPSINNWLYLGADAMAYAYLLSDDQDYMDRAAILFRTGSHDPWFEGDDSMYSETKQTINAISYGHIFLKLWADTH